MIVPAPKTFPFTVNVPVPAPFSVPVAVKSPTTVTLPLPIVAVALVGINKAPLTVIVPDAGRVYVPVPPKVRLL